MVLEVVTLVETLEYLGGIEGYLRARRQSLGLEMTLVEALEYFGGP